MTEDTRPLMVSIRCTVYNHEPYLRQCLDGFVMQTTNFRFEAIVHDDASTDNSASIIREYAEKYPDIIKPIYETENQYSKHDGSLSRIVNAACKGKYIAMCEGDDYWIDPYKLQKQVDFMEKHPDYGLVYTNFKERLGDNLRDGTFPIIEEDCLNDYLLKKGFIPTPTTLYRSQLLLQMDSEYAKMGFLLGDAALWIQIMHVSKIKRLSDITSVYRVLEESASHSRNYEKRLLFYLSSWELRLYFAEKYKLVEISNRIQEEIIKNKAILSFYKGDYWSFFKAKPWKYGLLNIRFLMSLIKKRLYGLKL